jgi:hypothetical protein
VTSFLDKLNLRPGERRFVVAASIVAFVVLNFWFVWPHFNDWKKIQADTEKTRKSLQQFRDEINKGSEYQQKKQKLEAGGGQLMPVEAAVQMRRTIDTQVLQSGVTPNGINDQNSKAAQNELFEERAVNMAFINTGERELVDFLFNISADNSMIRVRDLNIRPDSQLQRLQGSMTLVGSYQKKTAAKAEPASAKPGAKPATATPAGSTNKPAAKPGEKTADKPADKAANPAEKSTEKPAAKPAEKQETKAKTAGPTKLTRPTPPAAKPLPDASTVER